MTTGLIHATRALRHRAYRVFFIAQSFSLIGTWVQLVALSWLVWRLGHSPFWLGVTGFASQIPILIISPFAGVSSDRFNRQKLLIVTQSLSLLQSLILALLVMTGLIQIWHCVLLAGLLGCINAFDTPVRQSFTIAMIEDKADLPSAIALNSFMFNLARLLGPAVAGLVIAEFSESACFLFNTMSYLGVVTVLTRLRLRQAQRPPSRGPIGRELIEGIEYCRQHPVIRPLLIQLALMSLLVAPYIPLMPVFAAQVFSGDSRTLGLLVSAAGLGAIGATVFLATRGHIKELPSLIARGSLLASVSLLAFSQSTQLIFSLLLLVGVGAGLIVTAASTNTLIQHSVSDDKRGRTMSLYTLAFLGVAPIGSLSLGHLAEIWGASLSFAISGGFALIGASYFEWKRGSIESALRALP